jgi:hypothetical protein
MKSAEGELKRIIGMDAVHRIFGEDAIFPTMRSIVVPSPGHVFMEADWKQAEMFVLARLSDDTTMIDALTTPGRDLHDKTAIDAFGVVVEDENGNEVPDQFLLDLAAKDFKKYGTTEGHEFEAYQKKLIYATQKGEKLSRGSFKSGIRVSAKALNFGIP